MIWFTIALFFVSFLVTALLAPKPDLEHARAGTLEDVQFPRATEDAPIPLVLGKVRMNAPNTMWYGDFQVVPIYEKIKTGIFSSEWLTVGHKYYLGLDMGLALGEGVGLTEIWIDEENVWTGTTSTTVATTGTIAAGELFGGYKAGGGWTGDFTYYPGSFPQAVNAYVEGVVGAGGVPGYGGISHLVFEANYIGESNSLRKMSFVLEKYTNGLGAPNSGLVGDDLNPMEAMYQIVTAPWEGMGVATSQIDTTSWIAAATTLHAEGNGASVIVTSAQQGKTVIKELLRQIDGIMFQDPETGKLKIKLIRSDYTVSALDEYDEDDISKMRNFTKTSWEDVVAQVKVSFPQRDKDSSAVAISQDQATVAMIGRLKTVTMSFPFCYDPDLANGIASRERAQQSVPLFRVTMEMTRSGYLLRPGDVFKMSWPEYGLSDLVMRVQKHDLGELLNNRIVVTCVQDAFAVGTTVFAAPVASSWVAPVTTPAEIVSHVALDLPVFFGRKLNYPVAENFVQPLFLPLKPQSVSTGFSALSGLATGVYDYLDPDSSAYPATGVLSADYDRDAGQATGIDAGGFTLTSPQNTFIQADDAAQLMDGEQGLLYVDGEWIGFLNVTNGATAVFTNVHRGLFGSSVKAHVAGTRAYQVSVQMMTTGTIGGDLGKADTLYYKLIDRVGGVQKDPDSQAELTLNPGDTMRLPLRPRNLELGATRSPAEITSLADQDVTFDPTLRNTVTAYPTEIVGAETPAETERYNVSVYLDGVESVPLGVIANATTTFTVPFSTMTLPAIYTDVEIRVWSTRVDPDTGPDLISDGYASLTLSANVPASFMLLEGDMQSGTDMLLLEGDMQSGTDKQTLEGDEA